ncbi:hypothetical protein LGK95_20485 [Clostridium algoriphilum]|uniref:hypothetical protein n=1 Tax=Clostridium algoriphilum TaxID=198347 RepID=UPI001CF2B709|nr:hypothetical protein [Clostridium algoriphilum]MCB2295846.1 hypothetical protein [Clostridium algoriphilum]
MSEYKLDIPGDINLSDYSSIHDYMGIIERNDKFTITSKIKDPQEMKLLCKMLEDNYFTVVTQGDKENGEYYITSKRER